MNTITCQGCGTKVARGHAHIRSIRFEQVGWCRPCWTALSVTVPSPRTPSDVPVSQTTVGGRA